MSYGYGGGYPPQGGGGYPPQGGGYPPQGGGYGGAPVGGGAPPSNHLVWAILSTIFCCQVPGIVSIVFASQVNSKYQQGDYAGAVSASNKARLWAIIAAIAWVIGIILWIIFYVIVGIGASSPSSY